MQIVVDSVHEMHDADKAHRIVERFQAAGKVVIRVRRPWERESVQGYKLASDKPEERPQDASCEDAQETQPESPLANVPSCSLGPDIVDRVAMAQNIKDKLQQPLPWHGDGGGGRKHSGGSGRSGGVRGLPAGWEFAHDEEGEEPPKKKRRANPKKR